MNEAETTRAYYRALDAHDYDDLAELLDSDFIHYRPDRTIESCERFVRFMREERPMTDTTHEIRSVFRAVEGEAVAARGRLLDADGEALFEFVDVHEFADGAIAAIHTYTR